MQFVYGDDDQELNALMNESLAPRSPDFLLDLAVQPLTPDSRLLDVGCKDARHLIPLVRQSGCTGVGIDPIDRNLRRARAAVTAADLDQRIEIGAVSSSRSTNRRREEVIRRFGNGKYDLWEASLQWSPFLLLGKLEPVAYVLRLS